MNSTNNIIVLKHIVYLIESGNYYKIGFTSNLQSRIHEYNTHNPDGKLIDMFNAPKSTERILHEKCNPGHHRHEGFNKDSNIIDIFNEQHTLELKVPPLCKNMFKEFGLITQGHLDKLTNITYTDKLILDYLCNNSLLGFEYLDAISGQTERTLGVSKTDLEDKLQEGISNGILIQSDSTYYLVKNKFE